MADETTSPKDPGRKPDWDQATQLTAELAMDEIALRKKYDRRARVWLRLSKAGASIPLIAKRMGVSRVQVGRHLDRAKGDG